MEKYTRHVLDNGLTLLLLPDYTTQMASVCVLYRVGSRDEDPKKTGLAHLFEHLMFSNCGKDIDFDEVLQNAGAESNAFTTPDTTNYYNIAPAKEIELLIALEALRMKEFKVPKKDFITQQRVVIEEFSEHYLNNPYGLFSHQLFNLAYQKHPYRWPVIGVDRDQIAQLSYDDATAFFDRYYNPSNAILAISGNINSEEILQLVKKYFEVIPGKNKNTNIYPQEDKIQQLRSQTVHANFPEEALYIAIHSAARKEHDFYTLDIFTDLLAEGKSSLLYSKLKKEKMLFSGIDCYLTTTTDPGLIIVEGKLNPGVSIETGEEAFWSLLDECKQNTMSQRDWEKYQHKNETAYLFSQVGVINQALNISYSEWLGDADLIYTELDNYRKVTKEEIVSAAKHYFDPSKVSKLYYRKEE